MNGIMNSIPPQASLWKKVRRQFSSGSMRWRSLLLLTLVSTVHAAGLPDSFIARTPADAYGGGQSMPQPLTPEAANEVYRIPVPIAPGPFDGTWKSFTPDKLKSEPAWWREAKIGIWFHWGPQSMGRNGDWYARFLYQLRNLDNSVLNFLAFGKAKFHGVFGLVGADTT